MMMAPPGRPKHVGRKLCVDCVYILVHEKLVRMNLTSCWVQAMLRDYAVPEICLRQALCHFRIPYVKIG
jgi:hypothetical protein